MLHLPQGRSRSWRHGAVEFRRRARLNGYAQDGGVVWRRDGVDGKPDKVSASLPALEVVRWKTAAAASGSPPDRCVTQSRHCGLAGASGFRC